MTAFAERLTRWQRSEGRKALPWLRTRDPFQRLVAEVMLQQTQTGTVAPYWERFVGRWPTAAALAAEDRDVVMKAWEGLGYYRRCRLLCDAAERVVTDFGGVTPSDYASLLTLPGIGDATAASLAAAITGERRAMIDGNVKRVLSRVFRIEGAVGEKAFEAEVRSRAEAELPGTEDMAAYTQGLMDLGATVCRPKAADCGRCPVALLCRSHAETPGEETALPRPKKPLAKQKLAVGIVLVRSPSDEVLLGRAPEGVWHGLWVPPMAVLPEEASENLPRRLKDLLGVMALGEELPAMRHELTHRSLTIRAWLLDVDAATFDALKAELVGFETFPVAGHPAVPVPVKRYLVVLRELG